MTTLSTERLAIDGGTPIRRDPFPAWPVWDEREEQALLRALRSGKWGIGSEIIAEFEENFASMQEARYCVSVPSGTAAIAMALRGAEVTYGDEVITTPYTFVATVSAVLHVGAIPVFADIEPQTYQIDARSAQRLVRERTKAIIPVHIGGCPADMDAVLALAEKHKLLVIEDCAQAHLAAWKGRRVGAIGDLGTFSFQSSKNIPAGEGGAVVGDDDHLMDRVWSYRNVGRVRQGAWYQHEVLGTNARMSVWQAAVLLAQMTRAEKQLARRERNAAILTEHLADIPGIRPLERDARVTHHAYHLYIFRYDRAGFGGRSREEFLRALSAEGIPACDGYTPLYAKDAVMEASQALGKLTGVAVPSKQENAERCPVAERVCREEDCWLTQNLLLGSEADTVSIAEAIAKVQRAWK
ncbi:MAG: DegT/DnrJ/EryC1/StrS family aminotransferase [Anaerolineae bacterium]|nr:DegT/DnrJ/EryC1/StrS family aminotransferase [Anaerolineae bacterium]